MFLPVNGNAKGASFTGKTVTVFTGEELYL